MDVRGNAPVRQSGAEDRERDALRLANSGAVQGEDRSLSIGVDGWEKSKMKKKRSGIKADVSSSCQSTKPADSYDEVKQQLQQRPVSDARSRINKDNFGFRYNFLSLVNILLWPHYLTMWLKTYIYASICLR